MNLEINDKVFDSFPALETERLTLRSFTKEDAEDFFQIRSNVKVMEYLDSNIHKFVSDTLNMIEKIFQMYADKAGINWIIEDKNSKAVMGYCLLFNLDRANCRAEIGYALKPEYWRMGIATEAIEALIKFGFGKMGLHGIEANVNPKNTGSKKLLEKIGFRKEAYFREHHLSNGKFSDSEIYCIIESDLNARR
jgi:ribosomal-protein-alanine N-acetyltransferase